MTRHHLLDASALLALLLDEPGAAEVQAVFDDSEILTINLAEVARKLFVKGVSAEEVETALGGLNLEVVEELGAGHAIRIGEVAAANRKIGMSLGDAACVTMAACAGQTAVTADRMWSQCTWPDRQGLGEAPALVQIR